MSDVRNDTELLDSLAACWQRYADEQIALFKRPQPDYTADNEDLLMRFMADVEKLLGQRPGGVGE